MNYRAWQLKTPDPAGEQALREAGCDALVARVLAARGCHDARQAADLLGDGAELSDPYLLRDMDKAVARIRRAVEEGEPLVIFGDYDVDGVCATAILYDYLSNLGAHVRCKLPTRDGGGYGINRDVLQKLADKGYTLVVTVDNGISAVEEAAFAKELGIDLVITDHHLPPDPLPEAVAVVDPQRLDDESPFKELCGAGVAFKLVAALEECAPAEILDMYGDLVTLGTIADVMPLVGENRTLVRDGLALLQDTMRPGLQALLESAGYADRPVTAETVSFGLAPRLNAPGRMNNAAVSLKLLLCGSDEQAAALAARLAEINTERQQTEQQLFAEAQALLEAHPEHARQRVLVVAGENWHAGVIGIVASRLMERYGRPAIVISLQDGVGRGSGRAPVSYNLHGALAACAGTLVRFGGHAAAAGLLVEERNIDAFRQAINDWTAQEYPLPKPVPLSLDAAVDISELTVPAVQAFDRLAPFGRGNPVPLLLLQNVQIEGIWPLGADKRHTRLRLRQQNGGCFVSLFGTAPENFAYPVGSFVDAAVEVGIFTGRNGPMVSAHLKGIRPAGVGDLPSEQAALFDAFRAGLTLSPAQAANFLPQRADTVALYKMIRGGSVFADDLMPVFA
ncbi:MAG: single-stranded-DNA-specific exonuclease RecJ, partial [Gemmiger sp.]